MQFGAMLRRERDVGEHVVLTVVHQGAELGPACPQLVGDMTPSLMRCRGVGLQKSLSDRGSDHGVLAFRHVGQGVAHSMHAAPLPGRTEHAGDGEAQAVVSIGVNRTGFPGGSNP